MTRYEIVVAGTTLMTVADKAEAETLLKEARSSFLGMVHPKDVFYIREKK